jgi:hypothetical protein
MGRFISVGESEALALYPANLKVWTPIFRFYWITGKSLTGTLLWM